MGSYQKWCHKVFKQASIGIRFDEMLTGIGFQRVDLFAVCCFALFPRRESSNNMFGLKCIYVFTSTFQQQVNIFTELNSTIQKNETFVFQIWILTWVLIRAQKQVVFEEKFPIFESLRRPSTMLKTFVWMRRNKSSEFLREKRAKSGIKLLRNNREISKKFAFANEKKLLEVFCLFRKNSLSMRSRTSRFLRKSTWTKKGKKKKHKKRPFNFLFDSVYLKQGLKTDQSKMAIADAVPMIGVHWLNVIGVP